MENIKIQVSVQELDKLILNYYEKIFDTTGFTLEHINDQNGTIARLTKKTVGSLTCDVTLGEIGTIIDETLQPIGYVPRGVKLLKQEDKMTGIEVNITKRVKCKQILK